MKDLLEKWKTVLKGKNEKYLKLLFIPLIVIALMIAVIILDKPGQDGRDKEESVPVATESSASPAEESGGQGAVKPEIKLQKEAVPEIHDLMEAYFKARKTCDIEALSKVYGGTSSSEELNGQLARLEEEVKFYQSFENLVCYTAQGEEDGDYVIYARFDIKFRQAETLAPSLIVCYGKTAADGSVYLVNGVTKEQSQYMEDANQSDQVQAMAKEVNSSLEKALKSDENLLAVYHTLMDEKEVPETAESSEDQSQELEEETESASQ